MEWNNNNILTKGDLRAAIREGKVTCAGMVCERKASDVHHLDHNHSNNDPSNLAPACKLCHDAEHGITADLNDLKQLVREFYAVQDHRKALANRIGAYERLGIPLPYAQMGLKDIEALEAKLQGYIRAMLKHNAFYNAWLKHVKGIGPLLAASLIADLGSPERFNTVGQLWAYCGLHVNDDGEAPRRKKGQMANWNGALRMTCYKVASQFVRTNDCLGRRLYDEYKQYYIDRDGADPKWQPHKRAMRRVMKDFVRCLWRAWMNVRNLPLSQPHANTKIFEDDWVSQLALKIGDIPSAYELLELPLD